MDSNVQSEKTKMMDATIFLREKKRAGMAGCDPPGESHGELQPSRAWQGR